ncbi:fibronectin type III domain-containing protein [Candidatus Peregrinibacteria bacterium]|nr:MAG: fibronectin type III domain-containing protein [Candidatus Peregrinibacteria bacterium]
MANLSRNLARTLGSLALLSLLCAPLAQAEVLTDSADSAPSEVENLQAYPGDGQVTLSWDAATDDGGVDGYTLYTGLDSYEERGSYNLGSTDVGDTTTYVMENLTNEMTYYFAVKAYDEDGNESEVYSNEVEVTPAESDVGDFTGPMVTDAEAVANALVQVEFSEAVSLPLDPTSAFSLEASDGAFVDVLDAYVSEEDPSTVFLVTDTQIAGAEYTLTAGIQVEDLAGNPVSSGTSDTGLFTGSALERVENDEPDGTANASSTEADVDEDFEVEEIEASGSNEVVLHFSQKVTAPEVSAFTIQMAEDASEELEVLALSVNEDDLTEVTLVTEDMEPGYDYVLTLDETLLNEAGDALPEEARTVDFTAQTLDLEDVIAPEDITDLLSKITAEDTVLLTWDASVDSAGDLAKYFLYQSMDGGETFDDAISIDADETEYEVDDLTPGESYTFKVTAVDENGNESEGVMSTVSLPEAGPEMLLLGLMALAGAGVVNRRKRG